MNLRSLNTNITKIKFQNSHVVYENFVKCTIKDYEFNLSYNPSLLSGSQAALLPYSSSDSGSIFWNISGSRNFGILKDFATGSISGSEFSPYVTTVGLYNDAQDLLAIAKMAAPMPISDNTDMTFLVKWDTQWVEKPYFTPSPSRTPSISVTPSIPASISRTPSISKTPSTTPSISPSNTPPVSFGLSATPSYTPSPTPSLTPSITLTPSTSSPTTYTVNLRIKGHYNTNTSNTLMLYYRIEGGDWVLQNGSPYTLTTTSTAAGASIDVPVGLSIEIAAVRRDTYAKEDDAVFYVAKSDTNTFTGYCGKLESYINIPNADTTYYINVGVTYYNIIEIC